MSFHPLPDLPPVAHRFVPDDVVRVTTRGKILGLETRNGVEGALVDLGPIRGPVWFALAALEYQGRCQA